MILCQSLAVSEPETWLRAAEWFVLWVLVYPILEHGLLTSFVEAWEPDSTTPCSWVEH